MSPAHRFAIAAAAILALAGEVLAQSDSAPPAVPTPKPVKEFRWKTAGGNYVDPTSFFSLHGYVDAVFAGRSPDWTGPDGASPGMPGQVLVPNTPKSSFQYDAALFVSSELSERSRLMMEWHLVSDPGGRGAAGPGGNTIVMTEATASWDLVPNYLTMSGGLYWAPFATVNVDWLGAQNLFTLVPIASSAFPAHFNERGLRLDGAIAVSPSAAVNYVVSVGNGVENFDISGQGSYDRDEGKTIIGRIGVFPGWHRRLEIGGSVARGRLRDSTDLGRTLDDPLRYQSRFTAVAFDASYRTGALVARGYWLRSTEHFGPGGRGSGTPAGLDRSGAVIEAGYAIATTSSAPFGIRRIIPKLRLDRSSAEVLGPGGLGVQSLTSSVTSFGVSLAPQERMTLSLEYHVRREGRRTPLDNDRFVARLTAEF